MFLIPFGSSPSHANRRAHRVAADAAMPRHDLRTTSEKDDGQSPKPNKVF